MPENSTNPKPRASEVRNHVSAVINAFEEGLPDFLVTPMLDALNVAAAKAGLPNRVPRVLTADRYEYGTIASIIKAAEMGA